jgi:hypothetical protein
MISCATNHQWSTDDSNHKSDCDHVTLAAIGFSTTQRKSSISPMTYRVHHIPKRSWHFSDLIFSMIPTMYSASASATLGPVASQSPSDCLFQQGLRGWAVIPEHTINHSPFSPYLGPSLLCFSTLIPTVIYLTVASPSDNLHCRRELGQSPQTPLSVPVSSVCTWTLGILVKEWICRPQNPSVCFPIFTLILLIPFHIISDNSNKIKSPNLATIILILSYWDLNLPNWN